MRWALCANGLSASTLQMNTPEIAIRRAITLEASSPTCCQGWLEDNFHHFGVTIRHDGDRVLDVEGTAVRYPWTACPGAAVQLRALVGTLLRERADVLSKDFPIEQNCTHLFELAALTIAAVKRDVPTGRRELIVWKSDDADGKMEAVLLEDRTEVLRMAVTGSVITGPEMYAGRDLYRDFRAWIGRSPPREAERLWLLRRALWLADGADKFTPRKVADETGLGFVCHTYQPAQRHSAWAMPASRIDPNEPGRSMLGAELPFVEKPDGRRPGDRSMI